MALFLGHGLFAQLVINEVVSSNTLGISDEDGDYVDWIELFNSSDETVNIEGYVINDDPVDTLGWILPSYEMAPQSYLILFASGKDRNTIALNYKTIIDQGDTWQYVVPPSELAEGEWRLPGFEAAGWETGSSGFGYGDGDDQTVIQPLQSLFIRKSFDIENAGSIEKAFFHIDFDDGFIAFLNGIEIGRENVNATVGDYNNAQVTGQHEAMMYQGGSPSLYEIDLSTASLLDGENILSVQGYNIGSTSSDFSLLPFLTLGSASYAVNEVREFVAVDKGGLHTNFKVNNDGESLFLFNPDAEVVDSIFVVELPSNVSYGRYPSGNDQWMYFMEPTPGAYNVNPIAEIRSDTLTFSHQQGMYTTGFKLEITTSSPEIIVKYTTDGTEPSGSSPTLASQISVSSTVVIKAAPFYEGVKSGATYTKSFIIGANHELPVLSLTTDPDNLWDYYEGIFVEGPNAEPSDPHYGANYWMDWEKPVYMEYFDQQQVNQISQGAGIKISGGWSRMADQKSFGLFARSDYGKGSFKYRFFHDREYESFEALLFRNGGNDWQYTMLRDGFVSELAKSMNMDRLAFQPSVVYLNGEYWGMLNMRDKPNEHYFASLYNLDPDDVNILEMQGSLATGTTNERYYELTNFIQNRDLTSEDRYTYVKSIIDEDCFIDYQLLQIYVNNQDWPGNNIKFWNTNKPYSKFRWLIYDTDFGLNLYGSSEHAENTLQFATTATGPSWPNPPWSTLLLRRMLSNESFKVKFINRMADLMNTILLPEIANNKIDSLKALVESEVADHKSKWGSSLGQWENNVSRINTFNDRRPGYVRTHFQNYFDLDRIHKVTLNVSNGDDGKIKINTITPDDYPFSGIYFSDVPVTITALPRPGYKFVRWENGSNSTQSQLTVHISSAVTYVAVFEPTTNQDFNVVINEINYRSADDYDSEDWLELYNAGNQTIDLMGWQIVGSDINSPFVFPNGTVLYPKSYLVVCRNTEKFDQVYPHVKNRIGELPNSLSRKGELIELYDAGGELVDHVMYETSSPWPLEPFETASTLELINPGLDNNIYSSWGAGPEGGTPGMRNGIATGIDVSNDFKEKAVCLPSSFSDFTTLRFGAGTGDNYTIKLIDVQGNIKNVVSGTIRQQGTQYLDIFVDQVYPKGVYFVNIQTGQRAETIKVIKY